MEFAQGLVCTLEAQDHEGCIIWYIECRLGYCFFSVVQSIPYCSFLIIRLNGVSQVYEILDNAVDEAQAGYATKVDVILHGDNSVSVTDNGRGVCSS